MRVSAVSTDKILKPLEEAISQVLIPALTMQPAPSKMTRDVLALPACLGGMGLVNPVHWSKQQHVTSATACRPLTEMIFQQGGDVSRATEEQRDIKKRLHQHHRAKKKEDADAIISILPQSQRKNVQLAQEKGASSWLTAIPIQRLGFTLHKGAFRDAVGLRYGWGLHLTPRSCHCGQNFDINHVLIC